MNYLVNQKPENLVYILPEDEVWLPITNQSVPGIKPYYSISNYGRVFSNHINQIMSASNDGDDYEIISLITYTGRVTCRIHRLVMMTFKYFPGCEQYEVDHIDGYHYHNWVWNLDWVTGKENVQRSVRSGAHIAAENMYNSIFTNEEVHYICRQLELGKTVSELVIEMTEKIHPRQYKNMRGLLLHIKNGYAWKSISCLYDIPRLNYETFSNDEIHEICRCLENRMNYKEILDHLGYDIMRMSDRKLDVYNKVISNIRSGRTYTNITKDYNISSGHYQKLTENQIIQVCEILRDNYNIPLIDVLIKLGFDVDNMNETELRNMRSLISSIKNKKYFSEISDNYFIKQTKRNRTGKTISS